MNENVELLYRKKGRIKNKDFNTRKTSNTITSPFIFDLLAHRKRDHNVNNGRIFLFCPLWECLDVGLVATLEFPTVSLAVTRVFYLVGSSFVENGPLRLTAFLPFSAGP